MTKRILLVALVAAVVLFVAASAAFADSNGARTDYGIATSCASSGGTTCHDTGGIAPTVYPAWLTSAHASADTNADPQTSGPGCAGCHSGNYDPTKAKGTIDPTTSATVYPEGTPTPDSTAAFSEPYVGCSSCHYNGGTMHAAGFDFGTLANPQICGQCHARFGKTVATYTYTPVPTVTASIQPQYPVAYNPFTTDLATVLNVPLPGTPVGNIFWPAPITASAKSHGESAVQYEETIQGAYTPTPRPIPTSDTIQVTHFNSLASLQQLDPQDFFVTSSGCLKCHSSDYQITQRWNAANPSDTKPLPTLNTAKYGDTCVTCHDPHAKGAQQSVFNSGRNPQLVAPQATICTTCHNTSIGTPNVTKTNTPLPQLSPGQEVHEPQLEMMSGGAAIGVPVTPSVHKGDCVQCHMVPTGIEYNGIPGTGANHLFKVITPEYAALQNLTVSGRTGGMPNSACGQCHGTNTDPIALYLQPVLDARQTLFDQQAAALQAKLDTAAIAIGYADPEDAKADLAQQPDLATTNPSGLAFLKAETNLEFVQADSSRGIHNWAYTEKIFEVANAQVSQVTPIPFTLTIKSSKTSVKTGAKVTLSGTVSSPSQSVGQKVTIQRKSGSSWKTVATVTILAPVAPNTLGTYTYSWKVIKGKTTLRTKFGPLTISGVTRPVGYSKTITVTGK